MKIQVRTQKPFPNLRLGNFAFCDAANFYDMWSAKNKVINKITKVSVDKLKLFDSLMEFNDSSNELVVFVFKINGTPELKIILNSYRDSFILNPIQFQLTKYEVDNGGTDCASTFYLKISLRSLFEFLNDCDKLGFSRYSSEFLRELDFVSKAQLGTPMFSIWSEKYNKSHNLVESNYNYKIPTDVLGHFLLHKMKIGFNKLDVYNRKEFVNTDIENETIYYNLLKDTARLCNIGDVVAGEYIKYNIIPTPSCEKNKCKYWHLMKSTFDTFGSGCPIFTKDIKLAERQNKEYPCNSNKLKLMYMKGLINE